MNDKILIFGGDKGSEQATANVTMYDITKNEFKELEPLPYEVRDMATVKDTVSPAERCDFVGVKL